MGPLGQLLARHFTVFTYDRRGRGNSGDTAPYAIDREVEDIDALIKEAGGSACVFGISSGRTMDLRHPTLVMDGGKSPAWMRHGMSALAGVLPNVKYQTLDGQTHMLKAQAVVPVLTQFFRDR